jgi:hypothetical protein
MSEFDKDLKVGDLIVRRGYLGRVTRVEQQFSDGVEMLSRIHFIRIANKQGFMIKNSKVNRYCHVSLAVPAKDWLDQKIKDTDEQLKRFVDILRAQQP